MGLFKDGADVYTDNKFIEQLHRGPRRAAGLLPVGAGAKQQAAYKTMLKVEKKEFKPN